MAGTSGYRLGVDIGGTFTDFALLDEGTGGIAVLKVPSTPAEPSEAVVAGARALLVREGLGPEAVRAFVHGTTLAVNTIIERTGAPTGLLVTRGFRDILTIARHRLPDIFDFFTELPRPLVPRAWVAEIAERTMASGRVLAPPPEADVRQAVEQLSAEGVEAFAVCFLHAYRNPANEQAARRVIEAAAPGAYVSLSSELWPQMREYERGLVAVMNAYVGRKMTRYFGALEQGLAELGLGVPVLSTRSNGGVMTAREARERPVETLLSGPAAGVIGASFVARAAGFPKTVTFDMGGTSADVAVVDTDPRFSTENHVGDFPVIMPAIDVTSIGAGGGSIAWTDADGVLKVGPRSAGARPGPACYGQGGTEATVTDAYVCLGIIDPQHFLGGTLPLDPALAREAIARLGARLGLDVPGTAESVLRVATSQMYAALVPLMARKGVNLDDFALLAFGGAGPTHGFLLAREVGIRHVIVPRHPGVLCAMGSIVADVRRDFVRTVHATLRETGGAALLAGMHEGFQALTEQGRRWLEAQRLEFAGTHAHWTADVRYLGQSFELTIPLDAATLADPSGRAFRRAFQREYEQVYGYADERADLEVLDIRVSALGVTPKPRLAVAPAAAVRRPGAGPGERPLHHDGARRTARVLDRESLVPGARHRGPLIVEQYDATTFVPAGFAVSVDAFGNLIGEAGDGGR